MVLAASDRLHFHWAVILEERNLAWLFSAFKVSKAKSSILSVTPTEDLVELCGDKGMLVSTCDESDDVLLQRCNLDQGPLFVVGVLDEQLSFL